MNQSAVPTRRSWYVVFFLMPVVALVSAIRNYRAAIAKNIVWMFTVYYGFTFVISSENLDSSRYRDELLKWNTSSVTDFPEFIALLYSSEAKYVDILQPLVTFILSRFTDDYRVLFAFFGLIFGYFYSRNIWMLLSFVQDRIRPWAVPLIILFSLLITIWHINGFRFWTAAQIFFFGFLRYSIHGERLKGAFFCFLSVFVHFSFFFPVALLLFYFLLGNRLIVYSILYFSSFFVAQVSPETLASYIVNLPPVFQERTEKYINQEYLGSVEKTKLKPLNWYVTGRIVALQYTVILLLIVCIVKHRAVIMENPILNSLLCFGLLLAISVNLLGSLPSFGRFSTVSYLFIFSFLFLLVQNYNGKVYPSWVQFVLIAAVSLYCVVEVRRGFDTIGIFTVVGNPVMALFVDNEIPLIDLIK